MRSLHPSIVRFTFIANDNLAYYIDTRLLKAGKPHKFYDALPTNVDADRAGNLADIQAISDKRWSSQRRKPKRFKYANPIDLGEANDETLHSIMDINKFKAITEIEEAWLDKREPSWPAVKHLKNREWDKAELVFSHA